MIDIKIENSDFLSFDFIECHELGDMKLINEFVTAKTPILYPVFNSVGCEEVLIEI